jgi:photosystem II stability/assembly factor-like uncharacterized protein
MKKKYVVITLCLSLSTLFFWSCQQKENKISEIQIKNNYKQKNKVEKTKIDQKNGIEEIFEYQEQIRKPIGAKFSSYKKGYLQEELKKAKTRKRVKNNSAKSITPVFQSRGPSNVPGRTRGIIVDPKDDKRWFAATAGGGVWLTEDSGSTWTNFTSDEIAHLAATTIVISQQDSNVLYVGTGEPLGASPATGRIGGGGVFKTTNGGETWISLTSTLFAGDVARMIINPADHDNVLIGTTEGIYRTINGGTSWSKVYTSSDTVQDLDADPSNFNIQYGSINRFGLVKSTDAGLTWSTVFDTSEVNSNHIRFETAVSAVNPSVILISAFSFSNGTVSPGTDLYISRNAGATFTNLKAPEGEIVDRLDLVGGQGWFDNIVLANPYNENIFYVGGVELFKVTVNSNNTFTTQEIAATRQNSNLNQINTDVHVDQHGMYALLGTNNQFKILLANDGGIFSSNMSQDPGVNEGDWSDSVIGKNTTQFYGAAKQNGFDNYLAGAQDNGCWVSLGNDASDVKEYIDVFGGDGFQVIWHYDKPGDFLVSSQNNVIGRYINYTYSGFARLSTSPIFYTKFSNSDSNPDVVFSVSGSGVHRSTDFGVNWDVIPLGSSFTPSATTSAMNVKVSRADPYIVWAGAAMTESGSFTLLVSEDNGQSFNNVGAYDNPARDHNLYISGMGTSYTEKNRAYALFSASLNPKILKTEDLGATWVDITGFANGSIENVTGFPNVGVHSVLEMPFDKDVIWAGTDIGIFQTENGGANWNLVSDFPPVAIFDMKIVNDQVVIATHGRGVWSATIPELADYAPAKFLAFPEVITGQNIQNDKTIVTYKVPSDDVSKVKLFVDDIEQGDVIQDFVAGVEYTFETESLSEGPHKLGIQLFDDTNNLETPIVNIEFTVIDFNTPSESMEISEFKAADTYVFDNSFVTDNGSVKNELGANILYSVINNADHPYNDESVYSMILRQPLTLSSENDTFVYEDIAIVEPYTDDLADLTQFYDYVIIEASKDLKNWIQLDKYDARRFPEWLTEYNNNVNTSVRDNLFREQSISISSKGFSYGDTVVFRFSLVTDQAANSYGWAIKSINSAPTASVEEVLSGLDTFTVYPTISKGNFTIFAKSNSGKSQFNIFDISGREVYKSELDFTVNEKQAISINVSSGIYFVKMIDENGKKSSKKIVIE